MDLDDIKQAVKDAANEAVGERLDAFESRLAAVEKAATSSKSNEDEGEGEGEGTGDGDATTITREEFDALKASVEAITAGKGESDDGDGDGEVDEAKLAEAVKAAIDEKYGDVLKSVTKSAQPEGDDGDGAGAATKSNSKRDAWGRSRRSSVAS